MASWIPPAPRPSSARSSLGMVHRTIPFASRTAPHPCERHENIRTAEKQNGCDIGESHTSVPHEEFGKANAQKTADKQRFMRSSRRQICRFWLLPACFQLFEMLMRIALRQVQTREDDAVFFPLLCKRGAWRHSITILRPARSFRA